MTYLDRLRQSRNKAQVAYQEFMLSTRKVPKYLFCFFEGKDNPYYVPRITSIVKEEYCPIKCGGRDKVLGVHRLISNHSEYEKYKTAFFVDRDFNPSLTPSHLPIFETPCYSIENLYVSLAVFKRILANEFHLSEVSDTEFSICADLFETRQEEFHEAIILFNAWYACLIDIRNETGNKTGVKLNTKPPKDFIKVTLPKVTANYDLQKMQSVFSEALTVETQKLSLKLQSFSSCEQHKVFRGKYELWFLVSIIRLLLQDARNTKTVLKQKINFVFGDGSSLGNEQALNVFSAYAETPQSLIDYLKTFVE